MGRNPIYDDSTTTQIIAMYTLMNMSLNEIARKLNLHPEIVKRRLKKNGYPIRNLSNAMKISHQKRKNVEKNP